MRKIQLISVILTLTFIVGNVAISQPREWIAFDHSLPGKAPEITVIQSDINQTILRVKIHGMWVTNIKAKGKDFQILELPNYVTTTEVGKAAVPSIRGSLGLLSDTKSVKVVKIKFKGSETLEGFNIYPYLKPVMENDTPVFEINREFYKSSDLYPAKQAQVGKIGKLGQVKVVGFEVNPLRLMPSQGTLLVHKEMEIVIKHAGAIQKLDALSRDWINIYKATLINGAEIVPRFQTPLQGAAPPDKYLIITADNFYDHILRLAFWKMKKGLNVDIKKISSIGNSPSLIRNYLKSYYDQFSSRKIYVLLVGDVDQIDIQSYFYPNDKVDEIVSDHYYACLTGLPGDPDPYPDIAIGRISASNGVEVSLIVRQIIKYDKNPTPGFWPLNVLLVADEQDYPDKYTQCCEDIRTYPYSVTTPIFDRAYGGEVGITNTTVINKMNYGRKNIVNYRGHGSNTSWSTWNLLSESFREDEVLSIYNLDLPCIVYDIACGNSAIDKPFDCFAEIWLKTGRACANLGATRGSSTKINHELDKSLFKATYDENIRKLGNVMNYAKNQVLDKWLQSEYVVKQARLYLLLGDPEMTIRTEPVLSVLAAHPVVFPISNQKSVFPVTVKNQGKSIPGAKVCLWKGEEIHQVSYTNNRGVAEFLIQPRTAGTLNVTVSGADIVPYTGKVKVIEEDNVAKLKKSDKGFNYSDLPTEFQLYQNYPNPFNPETQIRFQIPAANHVVVSLFNTLGQEIRRLVDKQYEAGYHTIIWDGKDNSGNDVSTGMYFYQVQAGEFMDLKKMALIR